MLEINNDPHTDKTGYTLRFPALVVWERRKCWLEGHSSRLIHKDERDLDVSARDILSSEPIAGWPFFPC